MLEPTKRPRASALAIALVVTANCGSQQTSSTTTPGTVAIHPTDGGGAVAVPTGDAAAATGGSGSAAWSLSQRDLERIVSEGARAQLSELAPQFDMANLAEYAANPTAAPELSGHAVERLLDLATVELAANRGENAERIVRLVRARARNRNSAYVGNTYIAEARRRAAGSDGEAQQHAIEAIFRELPPERFNAATVFYQIFQRPQQLEARLERVHQSMVSMDTAKDALYYSAVAPPIVENRARYLAAIQTVRAENAARPARTPYVFSTVDLTGATDAHEVPIAVWDLGTNLHLFEHQTFSNAARTSERPRR